MTEDCQWEFINDSGEYDDRMCGKVARFKVKTATGLWWLCADHYDEWVAAVAWAEDVLAKALEES